MGCNCNKGKASQVAYKVSYWDRSKQPEIFATLGEAQRAIRTVQGRGTLRAVPANKAA